MYQRYKLPPGIEKAAERWAKACESDGYGDCDAYVMACNGEVVFLDFINTEKKQREFIFKHDGNYYESNIVKNSEASNE